MERIADRIDYMIENGVVYSDSICSIIDINVSTLLSNLKYKIQLMKDNYQFYVDLKKLVFKYRDKYVRVMYRRKKLNYGDIYKYHISIQDTDYFK